VLDYCKLILLIVIVASVIPSAAHAQGEYLVGPGDVLNVEVFGEKDLSGNFTVSEDGNIKNILLGDVHVNGLTTAQIEKLLTKELGKNYLVDPMVTVSIKDYRSHKVYVLGEVESRVRMLSQPRVGCSIYCLKPAGQRPMLEIMYQF
jgi:polysaccharide export outer membrane protein